MKRALRVVELTFWIAGVTLLGAALGVTLYRWHYQEQQERALLAKVEAPVVRPATKADGRLKPAAPPPPREVVGPVMPAALAEKPKPRVAPERKRAAKREDPEAFGLIEIPRLGLRAVVREGADEKTLARAVGLVPGGAYPGQPGNVILAAHRDTFFRPLRKIRVDDRIRVVIPPETYEYRVSATRVVSPDETSVLQSRGVEELTLVTCYPFYFVGPAPERFIVSAVPVRQQ
ncbi:MAG TPA: class D sortase [Thermoanaerobaculia bacterium]|nr:class D sortase [Thermoanaerobaculia bacterium]